MRRVIGRYDWFLERDAIWIRSNETNNHDWCDGKINVQPNKSDHSWTVGSKQYDNSKGDTINIQSIEYDGRRSLTPKRECEDVKISRIIYAEVYERGNEARRKQVTRERWLEKCLSERRRRWAWTCDENGMGREKRTQVWIARRTNGALGEIDDVGLCEKRRGCDQLLAQGRIGETRLGDSAEAPRLMWEAGTTLSAEFCRAKMCATSKKCLEVFNHERD